MPYRISTPGDISLVPGASGNVYIGPYLAFHEGNHAPGGGGTPADTVTAETAFGSSPNAGAATTYSRGDHTHGTPADPIPAHESAYSHALLHANTNDPSTGEKAALAGTSGTPGSENKYVTNGDPRNSDTRAPTAHGSGAHTGTIGTWAQIDKSISSLADLTTKSHTALTDIGANTHAQIDTHLGAAAPHSGHVQVGGQLGGTAASPDVRGLRETAGPTLLTLGAVADGEYLKRVGATVVGGSPGGGSSPPWYGVLYVARGDCDPANWLETHDILNAVAGPTPTGITVSLARCVMFRPPAALTVNRIRLFGVGATTNLYKFAIYPVGAGSARTWESGTVTTAANTWLNITAALPITLNANTNYWFCVTAAAVGTTAGFRSPAAPLGTAFWGANAAPLGNRALGLPVCAQFAVSSGAFPATLPAVAAAAYAGGSTGSVPLAFLDNST